MNFATIDNTDVRVSKISFGTASLHHLFSSRQRQQLLGAAIDIGITHFDTSPYYGYGLAEQDLGEILSSQRSGFTITTKIGLYAPGNSALNGADIRLKKVFGKIYKPYSRPVIDWSIGRARTSLENSLKRMKCDYVDFLFLHEPNLGMVQADEILRWMEDEKSRGTIRYWGLAGVKKLLEPWLDAKHPLSGILQTGDNIANKPADFLLKRGRKLQFTYGYLSSRENVNIQRPASEILNASLARNSSGSILISTRRIERLKRLGEYFL